MKRQPIATVRILKQPHLHPEAVRVEIDCPSGTTGYTSVPGQGFEMTVPQLITMAAYEHEERCGECDTGAAHQQGRPGSQGPG